MGSSAAGGRGDLNSMIGKTRGFLGLWTTSELRHGPRVRPESTFPLPQHRPGHAEMSEHDRRTDAPGRPEAHRGRFPAMLAVAAPGSSFDQPA